MNTQFASGRVQNLIKTNLQLYPHLQSDVDHILGICAGYPDDDLAEHLVALFAAEPAAVSPEYREHLRSTAFFDGHIDSRCWESKRISDATITRADRRPDDWLDLAFEPSIFGNAFLLKPLPNNDVPRVGSKMWIIIGVCKETFGTVRLGVVVDGYVSYYETYAMLDTHQKAEKEERRTAARTRFPEYDQRIAKMPEVFQERLKAFHRAPHFREDLESYELSVCELAIGLTKHLETPEAIDAWVELGYEERIERVPEYANYGHTLNSRDAACCLAKTYLVNPNAVPQVFGSEYLIVGQKAYMPQPNRATA